MKRLLVPVFAILVVLAMSTGCTSPAPAVNQPPVAYIDSISPTEVALGEEVTFTGHGTDADGTVVAYRWRSSKDGELSTQAGFSTSSLSEGDHIIYLKVQDNNGIWSDEVQSNVTVIGEIFAPMVINFFTASPESIPEGDSSTLSWDVSNAETVVIEPDVGSVAPAGSTDVSPDETTTYALTATNPAGSVVASVTVTVSEAPPPPAEHTVLVEPVISESGYVRDNGQVWPEYIYVGDDTNDISLQAFISFDVSDIPAGATITHVIADFSDYAAIYGHPFDNLHCLRGYPDDYGVLDSSDYFTGTATGAILKYCSADDLVIESASYVVDALQEKVGNNRFQMRLQFNQVATNGDGKNDIVAWTASHLPRLIVTYTTP